MKSLIKGAYSDLIHLDWYQKGGAATEMICSGIYVVTLVEYRMGNGNGLGIIRNAKAKCPDQKILLFTTWIYQVTLEQAKAAGADGYLKKAKLSIESLKAVLTPFINIIG